MIRCVYGELNETCGFEAAAWMGTFYMKAWEKEYSDQGCQIQIPELQIHNGECVFAPPDKPFATYRSFS